MGTEVEESKEEKNESTDPTGRPTIRNTECVRPLCTYRYIYINIELELLHCYRVPNW